MLLENPSNSKLFCIIGIDIIFMCKEQKNGFSLIEMIIAMAIFTVVISVVAMVFSNSSSYQKRLLAGQEVENNARYIAEFISRELRTAREINSSQTSVSLDDSHFNFRNYRGENIIYCLASETGVCDPTAGEFVARINDANPQIINTSTVRIDNLKFVTNDFSALPPQQKIITIFFTVKSLDYPTIKIDMQTSITARLY